MTFSDLKPTNRSLRVVLAGFPMTFAGGMMLAFTPSWASGPGGFVTFFGASYDLGSPFAPWMSVPLGALLLAGGVLALMHRFFRVALAAAMALAAVGVVAMPLTGRPEWAAYGLYCVWALGSGRQAFAD